MPESLRRVLVLHSFLDRVTGERIEWIRASPGLKAYRIEHCFAIELSADERSLAGMNLELAVLHKEVTSDALFERLERAVTGSQFDVLVVHTGYAFGRFPAAFREALVRLKTEHPDLSIVGDSYRRMAEKGLADIVLTGPVAAELVNTLW